MIKNDYGTWVEDENQVRQLFINNYKQLFALNDTRMQWVQTEYSFLQLDIEINGKLRKQLIDEEVKHVLFCKNPWKTPSPDGFHASLFQRAWSIVSTSVFNFIQKVWKNPSEISTINQTDICLIPK
ncbi:unnamed protein product [Lathyrus sativus]|nr:unnamed protein product [Lathyrus sativus]